MNERNVGTLKRAVIALLMSVPAIAFAQEPLPPEYNPALAPVSSEFGFDIEGCRLENDVAGTYDPDGGSLLCADSAYQDGNLGKRWNELDLVPHRITSTSSGYGADKTIHVIVGGDSLIDDGTGSKPLTIGYDVIGEFAPNTFLSDPGCIITAKGDNYTKDYGIGGADTQVIQVIEIVQPENTTCVLDFVIRLAVTSRFVTGSSNRSFIFAGTGAQSLPIPDVENPFIFSKTMTAERDTTYDWTLSKGANPSSVNFGNSCEKDPATDTENVTITVNWTKSDEIQAGDVNVYTNISVSNPALRTLRFDITDALFDGESQIGVSKSLSEASMCTDGASFIGDELVVEPGAFITCDLSWLVPVPEEGELALNDIATGHIDDPILGDETPLTPATASTAIQSSGNSTNDTAVVTDEEWIVGDNFQFLVDSGLSSYGGTLSPEDTLIGETGDPNSAEWNSGTVSDDGSATFVKTIKFLTPKASTGSLRDTAVLNSDTIQRTAPDESPGYLAVGIKTEPLVDLTIRKTIPRGLTAGNPGDPNEVTFTFDVSGPESYSNTVYITFEKPDTGTSVTTKTETLNNLAPGTYVVTETPIPPGWSPNVLMRTVPLSADTFADCAGEAAFVNDPNGPVVAKAIKVTEPRLDTSGEEAAEGWEFTLNGPGISSPGEKLTTSCEEVGSETVCGVTFASELMWGGPYTITEENRSGWAGSSSGDCTFNVSFLDLILGKTFVCTWTNVQDGTVIIEKVTDPDQPPASDTLFSFTEDITPGTFSLDGNTNNLETFTGLDPNSYVVSEDDPSPACALTDNPCTEEWDLISVGCQDDVGDYGYNINDSGQDSNNANQANIELDPGETVQCTFTNQQRGTVKVIKTEDFVPAGEGAWTFEVRQGAVDGGSNGTVLATDSTDALGEVDFGGEYFLPGNYQLCERGVEAGWQISLLTLPGAFNLQEPDADGFCAPFTLEAGEEEVFNLENTPPEDDEPGVAHTIGYWRNWSGDCTNGNQEDVLGATLPGITLGDMEWSDPIEEPDTNLICDAVQILSKRNIDYDGPGDRGENRAWDPAYALASQFLAYLLNIEAGAGCALPDDADDAQTLLLGVGFDGTDESAGSSGKGKKKTALYVPNSDKADWIALAYLFDQYNNMDLPCFNP